jgi:sugar transferase (PEP-CTERM/EpsH1 system associated)
MDILFLTAGLPYPPSSGATTRTYHLLRQLARRHRLHLVAYADGGEEAARKVFDACCASVTLVPWRETKHTPYFYVELLSNVFSAVPFVVSRFSKPAMARAVGDVVGRHPIDAIYCDFLSLTRNLSSGGLPPVLLTAHNVESVIWRRYLATERNPVKAVYILLQYLKMLRFERRTLHDIRHVACVSADDVDRLKALCPLPRYTIVPNGVDLEYFRPFPNLSAPYRLVFTGSMDWRPNQDAMRFFLTQIYPRIKRAEPRASLAIVGRQPPRELERLAAAYPDVLVTGTVPDVRPYLAGAAVYVVPLRVGGGTRLKILEALAMAKPVVSTTVGCEGLALTPERDLLVADEPEAFAAAVLRLFEDPALAGRLAQAGRGVVQRTYGWDTIARSLEEALQGLLAPGDDRPCAASLAS